MIKIIIKLIKIYLNTFELGVNFLWDQKIKSGLTIKSGVVKSVKINIVKTYKILGLKHHGC